MKIAAGIFSIASLTFLPRGARSCAPLGAAWRVSLHYGRSDTSMPIKMRNGVLRAPTMIVSGPGHLIGSQQQVDQFFNHNKGELPPWYKEWHEVLGDQYHMRILQTPYDVGEFFRGAVRDPHTPRVGFIANTILSL